MKKKYFLLIKYWIHSVFVKHRLLLLFYKYFRNLFIIGYEKEIAKRSNLSIFSYKDLVKPLTRPWSDFVPDNNSYGMNNVLKKYMSIPLNYTLNCDIEHGLFLGDYVDKDSLLLNVESIVTFGESRIKHLSNKNIEKKIIPIGPYIHYANRILSDSDFLNLKKKLGKVLLVYVSHSLTYNKSDYDVEELCQVIKNLSVEYDTTLINLHYLDIDKAIFYESYGFKIVTSGHADDNNFYARQRTLIELADFTMSNFVGTHIGYCVFLKKPHYLFSQTEKRMGFDINNKLRNEYIYKEEVEEIKSAFSDYSNHITQIQQEVVDKYWGVRYIKTPGELKSSLSFFKL